MLLYSFKRMCCGSLKLVSYCNSIAVSCQVCTTPVGSLDHNNISYSLNTTYILDGYRVQCEGIVTTWEFCYQTLGNSSVTFHPGIWNMSEKAIYTLIQSNTITFTPNNTNDNSCQNYTLPVAEQFIAPLRSVVGLYSNTGTMQSSLLRTNDSNQQITTYQIDGNQSYVTINGNVKRAHYNIAVRVYVGKLCSLTDLAFLYYIYDYCIYDTKYHCILYTL